MALSSYSDLKASIQSWMFDRSDLAVIADDCIDLCESDINRILRTRDQLTSATLALDANGQASIPDDYLEFRSVTALLNPRRALEMVVPSFLDGAYPTRQSGYPSVFTIDGGTITVIPFTEFDIEFIYWAKVPALSDAVTTNWLLDKSPNVYLYGCLKHACVFIGDERAATMGQMFNASVDGLVRDDKRGMYSRGAARVAGVTP